MVALVAVYALSVAMVAPHGRKAGSVKAASGEKLAPVVGAVGDSVTAGCAVAVAAPFWARVRASTASSDRVSAAALAPGLGVFTCSGYNQCC